MYKRILAVILLLCLLCIPVHAAEGETAQQVSIRVSGNGYEKYDFLTNGNEFANYTSKENCYLTVKSDTPFQSLYIRFNLECSPYTITDDLTGQSVEAGQYSFLHEYVTLPQATTSATLQFTGTVQVTEITAYTPGEPPEDVQIWQPCHEGAADILLLSTHGDDEHLFFAGLLPLYAAERNLRVQVAYMTPHRNPPSIRCHEILNGLWSVGVRNYPVIGRYPDFLITDLDDPNRSPAEDLEASYRYLEREGISEEDLVGYVVELIRRFKPQVVVGHDFAGEYGHNMHILYTDLLVKALPLSNNPEAYPELAAQYGLWDVPKTYIHLYEENPIVIDYDVPLEYFDGMTAFQVSQNYGFPCHQTQQHPRFTYWLYGYNKDITKATQIVKHNPAYFGLYRSLVGEDVLKNDFMENLICYDEQERLEAERLEQERLEAERLEQERLAEQLEQERLEAERQEQERLEAERQQQQQEILLQEQQRQKTLQLVIWASAAIIIAIGLLLLFIKKKKT